ncbi:MAG: hypothetical protein ACOX60_07020 [Massiliimalia sp.]|jgi:hypothetical protein
MKLDDLKKGFWGYQKSSVYQYIAFVEEEFSMKLMEKDAQLRTNEEQYCKRIRQLEEELQEIRQKYESQKEEEMMIASTLLDAQHFAQILRAETEQKEQEEYQKWEEELSKNQKELNQYHLRVMDLREKFCSLLHAMDEEVQNFEQQIQALKQASPDKNMTLFERKTESEDE